MGKYRDSSWRKVRESSHLNSSRSVRNAKIYPEHLFPLSIPKLDYRPELDGLRAFAVIPVIAFHFSPEFLPEGFAGVDVFFVISGFPITSLILKERQAGTFNLLNFWSRRIRRILPTLLFIDDDHLNLQGARLAKERIKHAISENIILVKDANKRGHLRGN